MIEISVVVATRNRAGSLARMLYGLAKQINTPPFEVIVGDNGSSDDTAKVVEMMRDRLQIYYVYEEHLGKGWALNAALKLTKGKLIVFTDDDVLPNPDWLAQMHEAAKQYPEHIAFGGRIDINQKKVPRWIRNSLNLMGPLTSAHENGPTVIPYISGAYPYGPNMAIRQYIIREKSNPYPVCIGPGTSYPVGDESFFWVQFSPPNATNRLYVPFASVLHEINPEYFTFISALRRCFFLGRCHGWLTLPAIAKKIENDESIFGLIIYRIKACRSIREFFCVTTRFIGYQFGRLEYRTKKIPVLPLLDD